MRWCLALAVTALPAFGGDRPGEFDYYVLSLGWSPTWCALTGDARGDEQCDARRDYSFTLHGLWPQNDIGWPEYCRTTARDPSRRETAEMADIMGSGGLAWHEWKKHGRCSGLAAMDYFALARRGYESITLPPLLTALDRDVKLPARVVEDAFIEANPALSRTMITVTCEEGRIDEVRICLTKDLAPRDCGQDAQRDCRMQDALMEKVR
ncbi:MAG TPA: ribonuclease T2 [Albidovulum sp.]|uniref:ribonuclease T2 family protein n=1 Tax=Albidovulum sp. TaxID=1872424 RepID=UPI002BCFC962|nr:ribonuclease T2 [Albidovulum sp.]